jgi:hypothetical protein
VTSELYGEAGRGVSWSFVIVVLVLAWDFQLCTLCCDDQMFVLGDMAHFIFCISFNVLRSVECVLSIMIAAFTIDLEAGGERQGYILPKQLKPDETAMKAPKPIAARH